MKHRTRLPAIGSARRRAWVGAILSLAAGAATAVPLVPVAYDLNNGHGVASGGSFNYWDLGYTGAGATSVDNAQLSGGLGDLTDGLTSGQNWIDVESVAGSGPYLGWRSSVLANPSVHFHFGGSVAIDTLSIHADDSSGTGGVDLPSQVLIAWDGGSTTIAVTDPDPGSTAPSWLVFSNLGIASTTRVRVQFSYLNDWVFIDEVTFAGNVVPEPGSLAQLGLGVALLSAWVARRRRR